MATIEQLLDWLDETDARNGLQPPANKENKKEPPMMAIVGANGTGLIAANIPSNTRVVDQNTDSGNEPNVSAQDLYDRLVMMDNTYLITNGMGKTPDYYERKQFKCKGRHQYREVDGVWVCECGRNIND